MRASENLHLTPQTISEQLSEFESNVGEKLFNRVGRGLQLTEMGEVVYQYADEMFKLSTELVQIINGRMPSMPKRLIVGIADVVPKLVAFRILQPVYQHCDPIKIVCYEGKLEQLLADLSLHRLDVVLADSPIPTGFNVRAYNHSLGQSGISFFAKKDQLKDYQENFPRSLQGAPMLMPTDTTPLRQLLDRWLEKQDIQPLFVGEFEDSALMKVFGQEGVGIFAAPSVIEKELKKQYNIEVIGRTNDIVETFYLISVERKIKNAAVTVLTEAAQNSLFHT